MARSSLGLAAAADVAKQIITLSTGVIAVTFTFFYKIQGSSPSPWVHGFIAASWFAFLATIGFAIATLMGVTTSLDYLDQIENNEKPAPTPPDRLPSAFDPEITWRAIGMIGLFVLALLLTAIAGVIRSEPAKATPPPTVVLQLPPSAAAQPPVTARAGQPPAPDHGRRLRHHRRGRR